jgi:plastocyanin
MSVSDQSAVRPPASDPHTSGPLDRSTAPMQPWLRVAAWAAGVVVAIDVLFLVLIQVLAHPLAGFSVLTLIGIALLRRRPRIGMWMLVISSLVALVDVGSAIPHLTHPSSGVDFIHAVVGVFGRLLVVGAGVAVWRQASDASARRVGTAAVGLLGAAALLAAVASLLSSGQQAAPQDAVSSITDAEFEDAVVASGGTLFVDNQDLFRHTYTVVGSDIDVHLAARQGERIAIDLDPGIYDIICVIPHHDFMTGTLEVQ